MELLFDRSVFGVTRKICVLIRIRLHVVELEGRLALEALLAEAAGVDTAKIPDALGSGYAGSNLLNVAFTRLIARDFEPGGYARQGLKDLDMVYELAKKTATPTPMTDQARALYRLLIARGHGEGDAITLLKLYDEEPV